MSLFEMLLFFLLGLISSRWFKKVIRAAGNLITGHKHVGARNPQAHNDRSSNGTLLADTLQGEAPRTQQTQKTTSLWPRDLRNHDPYVPAFKLFFPKVPAEAPGKKQLFRKVVPCRVFEKDCRDPYVPAYKLFFPKVPSEAPGKKQLFRTVVPCRVFEKDCRDPYVPAYKLFFKNRETNVHAF